MGALSWIIVGALAGWIASKLTSNNKNMGAIANIIVGIIGAYIGGFVLNFFGIDGVTGFNLWSVLVSILGATILLFLINTFKK